MKIHCKYDALVPVAELRSFPKNRNTHSTDQIKRLSKLIDYQGLRAPIVVGRLPGSSYDGCIAKGHGTLAAIIVCGGKEAPVVYQDFEDETQFYTFVQSDNAIASWSELDLSGINLDLGEIGPFDIDLLGIKGFEIEIADKYGDPDAVPEPPKEAKSKLGDLYQLGDHRLLCGDSTNIQHVERLMGGGKAELCFTSPPYGDQREYNDKTLNLNVDHIAEFITTSEPMVRLYAVVLGLMRREGEIFPYWDAFTSKAKAMGLKLLSWNIWDKGYAGSIGSASAMFTIDHEWVFIFGRERKELNRIVPNKYAGDIADHSWTRQQDGSVKKMKTKEIHSHRQLGTVIQVTPEKQSTLFKHPAMFPVALPEKFIEGCTDVRDIVYEPFSGSGSTLIACEKTGRRCFGLEIDPLYVDVIVARWEQFTSKKATLLPPCNP